MKIQYCSDLHLEMPMNLQYLQENPLKVFGDILIIAGDLVPFDKLNIFKSYLVEICEKFEKVFWLPGNHEYYFSKYRFDYEKGFVENPIPSINNLYLIDNECITIGKTKIIFSTMWSKIQPENSLEIASSVNDFYQIGVFDEVRGGKRKLRVSDFNQYHRTALEFIVAEVDKAKTEKEIGNIEEIIVVTHHVPTLLEYPLKYIGSKINNAFVVDLTEYIETSDIDFWIHGHHHYNHDNFLIGKTKILTNQLGYVRYNEQQGFDWNNVIEI